MIIKLLTNTGSKKSQESWDEMSGLHKNLEAVYFWPIHSQEFKNRVPKLLSYLGSWCLRGQLGRSGLGVLVVFSNEAQQGEFMHAT